MKFLSRVTITLRKSILDPQGKAVHHAVESLGMKQVRDVRMGKYVEVRFEAPSESEARSATEEMCRKLLANPVMEDFRFEIEKMES